MSSMNKKTVLREFVGKSRHHQEIILCGCSSLLKRRKKSKYKTIRCGVCKEVPVPDCLIPLKSIYNRYQASAWTRELSFNLDFFLFVELVLSDCGYCGKPPSNKYRHRKGVLTYNGIDRKDNAIGYQDFNCVSCCKSCNVAKLEMSVEEFLSWAQKVVKNCKRMT